MNATRVIWEAAVLDFGRVLLATLSIVGLGMLAAIFCSSHEGKRSDKAVLAAARFLDILGPFIPLAAFAALFQHLTGAAVVVLSTALVWPTIAIPMRAELLAAYRKPYVEAARTLGLTEVGIFFRHVLPNISWRVYPLASLVFGGLFGLFGALEFIGIALGSKQGLGSQLYDAINYALDKRALLWSILIIYGGVVAGSFALSELLNTRRNLPR